jgi:hypothetical protein
MAGAQNLAAGQNSVDLEYEREWVAREKKEDDEGNLFYHLPMLRRHHGRWSSLETEAAVHCSEQASNPGWWRWVGAMQLGLTHSAGVAGAQGRAGQMRAPQWEAQQQARGAGSRSWRYRETLRGLERLAQQQRCILARGRWRVARGGEGAMEA